MEIVHNFQVKNMYIWVFGAYHIQNPIQNPDPKSRSKIQIQGFSDFIIY